MAHVFDMDKAAMLLSDERMTRQPPQAILARLQPRKDDTWLDLGSGNGFMTLPLLESGCRVIALDLKQEMLDMLCARVPAELRPNLKTVRSELPTIPLPDGSVDPIVMVNVFHELPDHRQAVAEMLRVLRPGGHVHVVDHQKVDSPSGPPLQDRLSPAEVEGFFGRRPSQAYLDPLYYHLIF